MLGYINTSDTSQTGLRCLCTPQPAFYPRTSWLRRAQTVWPQWLYQPWPPLWTSHLRVTGPYAQSEPCAITWAGPQILGRTRSWSLSPSRPIKAIADFFLYLFQDRKLQPGTIDGYRSAIADKLGNSPINVSKYDNLARLLDSFHRDRPKGRRGIPSWNLSLVLHQLTKAPSEPLKRGLIKTLDLQDCFSVGPGFW